MLDPLTALGVAGNIVQFVDFSVKLMSKSHEIYKSTDGALVANKDLEAIAAHMNRLTERLRTDMNRHLLPPVEVIKLRELDDVDSQLSKHARRELAFKLRDYVPENRAEMELGEINAKCGEVAGDLISILRIFKVEGKSGKWKSFRMALKTVWDEEQIQKAVSKLTECRAALDTELLMCLRTSINDTASKQSEGFDQLKASTQDIHETLDHVRSENRRNQQAIMQAIREHQWHDDNPSHVAAFSVRITDMVEQERIEFLRERFLHRLRFMSMSDRQEEIVAAHNATFDWIYDTTSDQRWDCFHTWLKEGKGIYWISGKAGSGKSTLMKYIYNNKKSRPPLKQWAGDMPLVTASYYFWNSGTSMQKSQTGLLQSILYESLIQCDELIPLIFPHRWRSYDFYGDDLNPWSRTELMKGFDRLLKQDGVSAKFCFFIDGLDEYDGNHDELVKLFQGVAASSNVKMCLSSRPLLAFEDGFGKSPKLMLQDLTQNDINLYTDIELAKSSRFEILKMREPERAPELVTEIVDKSAGVFLWVTLVVKSLLEGLQNSDRISDLQRRLRATPASLEELYFQMMSNLDDFYKEQASELFQLVYRARLPLSVLSLSFADEEKPDFAIKAKLEPLNETELSWRYEETVRRVNSRCKGLLEVRASSGNERLVDSKVDFLHRTVKDFLETPEVWKTIASQSDPYFNPYISLMRSYLVQMKTLNVSQWDVATFGLLAGEFMEYAAEAERTSSSAQTSLLEDFCQAATDQWSNWNKTSNRTIYQQEGRHAWVKVVPHVHQFIYDSQLSFLSLAVSYGLDQYVSWKLDQDSQPVKTRLGRPLLNYAVAPKPREIWGSRPRNPKLIAILLKHGADPNLEFGNKTTWIDILQYCYEADGLRCSKSNNLNHQDLSLPCLETIRLLADAGANPEARISWNGLQISCVAVIEEIFSRQFPEEVLSIKQLIRQKVEMKVGKKRAKEIEKSWEQTPQETERQARKMRQMEAENKIRDAEVKEQQAERLASLYAKKIRPMSHSNLNEGAGGKDQVPLTNIEFPWEETESGNVPPIEMVGTSIGNVPKKKRWSSGSLGKFAFWRSKVQR